MGIVYLPILVKVEHPQNTGNGLLYVAVRIGEVINSLYHQRKAQP